ncbi:ankyrin [Polyplosphaeria fusca]|uniref:Ankyrin n=1 Tax=Polyplosphaeria fusca TaxID=682080 RepID=A0A9P4QT07_9PLEO|nr:ankyrin [Polyplosphaeria fusca]
MIGHPNDENGPVFVAFQDACSNNDMKLVLNMVVNCDPTTLTWGMNAALVAGHLELAHQLLDLGTIWDCMTASHAIRSLDILKLLMKFGFNVNVPYMNGSVLLPAVIAHNDELYIRYLLDHGANPNLGALKNEQNPSRYALPVNNSGACLHAAAAHCSPDIFALLLSHGAILSNSIPLHSAAGAGRPELPPGSRIPMLEYLDGFGLDVNALDDGVFLGWHQRGTPLHYAVMWGNVEEAKWLIGKGADPDKRSV